MPTTRKLGLTSYIHYVGRPSMAQLGRGGSHSGYPVDRVISTLADSATTARRVLDLACGYGQFSIALAQFWPHCQIKAIDIDAKRVALAARQARMYRVAERISLQAGDMYDPALLHGDWDLIAMLAAWGGFSDYAAQLAYLRSIMRVGARAVVDLTAHLGVEGEFESSLSLNSLTIVASESHLAYFANRKFSDWPGQPSSGTQATSEVSHGLSSVFRRSCWVVEAG